MMRDSHPGSEHARIGVAPGEVLAGKYRVDRVLGAGGMGVVVAAHHVHLDERVALKFLLPDALRSPEAVARFVREARAAVKIKSEHVARVTDVGHLENGAPYIVMEYLEGVDLSAWLRQNGPMPIPQAVDFVLQACEAIADAHVLGIVHRDLKPSNLFCIRRTDGQSSIKVLDFGISKILNPGTPRPDMTATSALIGSPLYMSPEQMSLSKGVDVRTDIWSLGIILFELITGRTPFEGGCGTRQEHLRSAVLLRLAGRPCLQEGMPLRVRPLQACSFDFGRGARRRALDLAGSRDGARSSGSLPGVSEWRASSSGASSARWPSPRRTSR